MDVALDDAVTSPGVSETLYFLGSSLLLCRSFPLFLLHDVSSAYHQEFDPLSLIGSSGRGREREPSPAAARTNG